MDVTEAPTPSRWRALKPQKRRRDLDDPFFEDGDLLCIKWFRQVCVEEIDEYAEEEATSEVSFPCQISNCLKIFHSNVEYEMHYNSLHKNQCSHCHRNFPTSYLLDIHILEWHDSMFELLMLKQKMFHCLVEGCEDIYKTAKERKNHLIKQHQYPSNYRFDKPRKDAQQRKEKKESKKSKDAEKNLKPDVSQSPSNGAEVKERLGEDGERMDTSTSPGARASHTSPTHTSASGRTFVYNVPKTFCFGSGSQRGFHRPAAGRGRRKKKHWHQQQSGETGMDTTVDIQQVKMSDLGDALDNV